jgi:hypothetical protein
MNGFGDWFDNNWVDLARLIVQCGILAAVVWYSRKILKTLRASQEQIGALLRLSVSGGATQERPSSIAEPAFTPPGFAAPAYAARQDPAPLAASPAPAFSSHTPAPAYVPEREQSLGGRVVTEKFPLDEPDPAEQTKGATLTPWVAAPSNGGSERTEGLGARMAESSRNLGRWLQEPPRRSGLNPLRKVIRWLQTPAGSRAGS